MYPYLLSLRFFNPGLNSPMWKASLWLCRAEEPWHSQKQVLVPLALRKGRNSEFCPEVAEAEKLCPENSPP